MLGVFPTWFQIRERGKRYSLAVRVQFLEPERWGDSYDQQEYLHLRSVHDLLKDRCNIDPLARIAVDPAYDWYTDNGFRYNYNLYPIPYHWRHPFLKWLNEMVGPDGVMPIAPHNIPDPNVPRYRWDPWGEDAPQPARRQTQPRQAAAPATGTVTTGGQVYTATNIGATNWTYTWTGGTGTGGGTI